MVVTHLEMVCLWRCRCEWKREAWEEGEDRKSGCDENGGS